MRDGGGQREGRAERGEGGKREIRAYLIVQFFSDLKSYRMQKQNRYMFHPCFAKHPKPPVVESPVMPSFIDQVLAYAIVSHNSYRWNIGYLQFTFSQ